MTDPLTKSLANFGKAVETAGRARVIQLPLWPEHKRGTPNTFLRSALFSAIQGKDRQFLKGQVLAAQDGIKVKFTGQQLNQDDLTLWETLVHIAKQHPLGHSCNFTAHGLLRLMDMHTGGDEHRRLHDAIIRLTACAVEITHDGKTYFGPLIQSGAKDELTSHYAIQLNRDLIRLYGETHWTALDWQQRRQLRRKPLAQALHAYFSSHRAPFPVKLDFLRSITGARNSQRADFKRQTRAALEQLVKIGFLDAYTITGDLVTVRRTSALPRSD